MSDKVGDSQLGETQEQMRERFVRKLKEDNFVLFSQPIVPAAVNSPEPPLREILVRYREEEEGLLPPGSFLPILQEAGLLPLLDRWVVAKLLAWGRAQHTAGHRMPHCTVNLSIETLRRDDLFGDYVLRGLQKMGVSAAALTFEIMTVDALASRPALARFIPPLRDAGVTFALSWFAGEEPAFELIPELGISYVKIDGVFAATIASQPKERARLAAIVQRCRKMGVQTVCMLVEDQETLEHMRLLRVDYIQGFGVEKPRPLDAKAPGA